MADRIGRKPVFYIACVSTAVSSLLFGFSVNLYMAIASRVFLGLMNPTVGLIKTVVSELCAPKDQTFAMSVVSASWSIGLVVGPSIGGWTARPAVQYPGTWIADIRVFAEFPYLLPNLITALFCCISMVFIWLYLPETLGAIVATKGEYEMVRVTADDEPGRDPESGENTDVGSGVNRTDNPPSGNAEGDDATLPGSAKGDDSGMLSSLTGLMRIEAVRVSLLAYFALSYVAIVYDEIGA